MFASETEGFGGKGRVIDEKVRYKPAREALVVPGYRIDLSTGPLVPPIGKLKHVGIAAVYEETAEGIRPVRHGIGGVYGRTRDETICRMKEAILDWIDARESEQKRGQGR